MRRILLTLISVTALTLTLPAAPATATQKSKFERVGAAEPFDIEACGTTITVTEEVNQVRERTGETKDGGTITSYRGRLVMRLDAADGRTTTLNVSGPLDFIINAEGDRGVYQFTGHTLLFPYPAGSPEATAQAAAGLPAFAVTSGLLEIVDQYNAKGEVVRESFTRTPPHAEDVCTLLD
jgi:hypothetical protein